MRYLEALIYFLFLALSLRMILTALGSPSGFAFFSLNPWLIALFFALTLLAVYTITSGESRLREKFLMVISYAFVTRIVAAIVFFPGISGDQWFHLAHERTLADLGTHYMIIWPFPAPEMGSLIGRIYVLHRASAQYSLIAILSRITYIDVFWVHTLLLGVLWSFFVPIIAFKITKTLGWSDRAGLLAGIIVANEPNLIAWSFVSVPNSFGFLFFFLSMYFLIKAISPSAKRRDSILLLMSAVLALLFHDMTGIVTFSLISLAFGLKQYYSLKGKHSLLSIFSLFSGFAVSIALLPAISLLLPYIYPVSSSFSFSNIFNYNIYQLILTNYSEYSLIEGLTFGTIMVLGIIGMILVAQRQQDERRPLSMFLILAFSALFLQYRVYFYFVEESLFGLSRLYVFWPFIYGPFAAFVINHFLPIPKSDPPSQSKKKSGFRRALTKIRNLNTREIAVIFLISLGFSGLIAQGNLTAWNWLTSYGLGSIVSINAQEAAEMIHQEYLRTHERYAVISDVVTEEAGAALVGQSNYNELYLLYGYNRDLYVEAVQQISADPLVKAAAINNVNLVYFVMVRWSIEGLSLDFDRITDQFNKLFQPFATIGSGDVEIRVFRFAVPLKPYEGIGPPVTVFSNLLQTELNTTYSYKILNSVEYSLNLKGALQYQITQWPDYWSFDRVTPTPESVSIDANTWINFTGSSTTTYNVTWVGSELYKNVAWKDDSFLYNWTGAGHGTFSLTTDGDIATYTQTGTAPFDYSAFWKPLPSIESSSTLVARIKGNEAALFALSLWSGTGTETKEEFFSGLKYVTSDYRLYSFSIPLNKTYNQATIWLKTTGGTAVINIDYLMLVYS